MKETKIHEIISSMTKSEFEDFVDFLNSPYFNKNRSVKKLYKYILKNYDKFVEGKLTKEKVYGAVYPGKFKEKKYWKLTSGLAVLLDSFLIQNEFKNETNFRNNLLLEAYRVRGIERQFRIFSNSVIRYFEEEFNRGISYFQNRTHFYYQRVSNADSDSLSKDDIKELFENMKMEFITVSLSSINVILNIDGSFKNKFDEYSWHIRDVLDYIDKNRRSIKYKYLTVYIFFLSLNMHIGKEDEKNFLELKNIIKQQKDKLSRNILRHALLVMFNYAMYRLHSGAVKFIKEVFWVDDVLNERRISFYGEFVHPDYFYSVVEKTVISGDINKAEDFIKSYSKYLPKEYRESSVHLSRARVDFECNEYDKVLNNLLKVENLDTYYYLIHKSLLLSSYYELGNEEGFDLTRNTVNKYLKRNTSGYIDKSGYSKFLKFLGRMMTIKRGAGRLKKDFIEEVNKEKNVFNKVWLDIKLKELL